MNMTYHILSYIPSLLRLFSSKLFTGREINIKVAPIGHAVIDGVRPRAVISSLQYALPVQLCNRFPLKYLLEAFSSLGYCLAYKEALKFQRNAATLSKDHIFDYTQRDQQRIHISRNGNDAQHTSLHSTNHFSGKAVRK